jgi:drug/metabolite transporter (DMT)-like permease
LTWFILALLSALFSAVSTLAEKKSLFSLDALDFSFIISLVTLVFSIPFFILAPRQDGITASLIILFIKTVMSAGAFLCVMLSMKNLELSEALPLLAVSPALVALLAFILIGDNLRISDWTGIFLIVAGTYVLELKKGNGSIFTPFGTVFKSSKYVYVLAAIALFTITSLMDRILLKGFKLPPYTFMAYQQLFYALIFTAVILFKRKSGVLPFKGINKELWIMILLVAIFTVVYRFTQIAAVRLAPVALVLAVKRISVLIAIILGGKLFNEKHVWRRFLAAAIILAGISLLASQASGAG